MIPKVIGILCWFFNWLICSVRCKRAMRRGVSRLLKKEAERCTSGKK